MLPDDANNVAICAILDARWLITAATVGERDAIHVIAAGPAAAAGGVSVFICERDNGAICRGGRLHV